MPGNVQNANPTVTMPVTLATQYADESRYLVDRSFYRDGESQRRSITATARRAWTIAKRLPAVDLNALYDFFVAQMGKEFYFVDKDGVTNTVRFDGPWNQTSSFARTDCTFRMVEVN